MRNVQIVDCPDGSYRYAAVDRQTGDFLLRLSDRAALLVTQDPHVIGKTMMKLAGGTFASKIDYEQFLEQGREFQKNYDAKKLDKFWADIINAGLSHPFPIWRVSEILKWVESGEYDEVLKNN